MPLPPARSWPKRNAGADVACGAAAQLGAFGPAAGEDLVPWPARDRLDRRPRKAMRGCWNSGSYYGEPWPPADRVPCSRTSTARV